MKLFTILFLLILVVFPVLASPQQESSEGDDKNAMEGNSMMTSDRMMTGEKIMGTGLIDPYPDFIDLQGAKVLARSNPTVLFFYATWCPSCKQAKEDLQARVSDLEGINVLIVDYDNSDDLQKKYGVTYQHSFVQIDAQGDVISKWSGGSVKEILKNVKTGEMM